MEFLVGENVTLKHYTGKCFDKGKIIVSGENYLSIMPEREFAVYSYFKSDPIVLGYKIDDEVLMCECAITDLHYDCSSFDLQVSDICRIKERRLEERFPTSLYGVVAGPAIKGTVYISNISNNGMCITTGCNFNEFDELRIETHADGVLLPVKTQVIWKKEISGYIRYGLKIVNMESDIGKKIEDYIESLKLRQQTALNTDYYNNPVF